MRKLAALAAMIVFAFPAIAAAPGDPSKVPTVPPKCTPAPPVFDMLLKLDESGCQAFPDGSVLCPYPAPKAAMGGITMYFDHCYIMLRREQCDSVWEPWFVACTEPHPRDKDQQTL